MLFLDFVHTRGRAPRVAVYDVQYVARNNQDLWHTVSIYGEFLVDLYVWYTASDDLDAAMHQLSYCYVFAAGPQGSLCM